MLGTRCAAAGGVLVRNRRRTGGTVVLLPLFLFFRFKLPADAPSAPQPMEEEDDILDFASATEGEVDSSSAWEVIPEKKVARKIGVKSDTELDHLLKKLVEEAKSHPLTSSLAAASTSSPLSSRKTSPQKRMRSRWRQKRLRMRQRRRRSPLRQKRSDINWQEADFSFEDAPPAAVTSKPPPAAVTSTASGAKSAPKGKAPPSAAEREERAAGSAVNPLACSGLEQVHLKGSLFGQNS